MRVTPAELDETHVVELKGEEDDEEEEEEEGEGEEERKGVIESTKVERGVGSDESYPMDESEGRVLNVKPMIIKTAALSVTMAAPMMAMAAPAKVEQDVQTDLSGLVSAEEREKTGTGNVASVAMETHRCCATQVEALSIADETKEPLSTDSADTAAEVVPAVPRPAFAATSVIQTAPSVVTKETAPSIVTKETASSVVTKETPSPASDSGIPMETETASFTAPFSS